MISFSYQAVRNEQEALTAAAAGGRYIAGGTTLIDLMREEVERPQSLIDINRLPMRDIRIQDGSLVIGALARMADTAANPLVATEHPLIAEALLEGASPQLRNMASIGGNLMQRVRCPYFRTLDAPCNKRQPGSGCAAIDGVNNNHAILGTSVHCVATHPSDLAVALVALEASIVVRGRKGERELPVEDLYRLPGDTPHIEHAIGADELIVEVVIPRGAHGHRARYLKVRDRASYEFALVSVAAALDIEGGLIRTARIAAGGVGTKPWRLRNSETLLVGKRPERRSWEQAAEQSIAGAQPLPGNRYKIELLWRTVIRTLEMAGEIE